MSNAINKVFLMGYLGADAEVKHAGETSLVKFRMATSESWLDKDKNKQERTEWHNVTMWKRDEKFAQWLKKGKHVYVQGSIRTHSYDKEGQKHFFTEIIGEELLFLGGGDRSERSNGSFSKAPPSQTSIPAPF